MTKYYPQAPTDWTTALEKIYAKQSEQLQRHHDQLRQRDQQLVAKAGNESLVNTLGSLAQFSSTVRRVNEASKARKAEKDVKYQEDIYTMLSMNPDLKEKIVKFTREYDGESNEIFKSHKFLTDLERSVGAKNKEALQAILKRDPRRMIILQETLARDFTNQLPGLTSEYRSKHSLTDDDGNKLTNAEITKLEHDFKSKELQKFGISEKLAAKIVVGEVNRQTETNKGIRTAKINSDFHTQLRASAKAIFRTASGSVDTKALPESIYKEIVLRSSNFKRLDDGTTALQQATEEVVNDLIELADNGYIPMGALAGLADYKFEHSAGADGKASVIDAFFAKDGRHFNRLIRGVERGQSKFIAAQTGIDQAALEEIKVRRSQGSINAKDNDLLDKISHRGLVSDESIEGVREVKPQDSNFFVNESKYFETTKIDGTFLTKSNIARAKLNDSNIAAEQEAIIASQESQQFPKFEDRKRSHDQTIADDSDDGTFDVKTDSYGGNTWKGQLSTEMAQAEDLIYMKYFNLNPNDPDIKTKVLIDMDALKLKNGFGIKIGEKGAGIWSKDKYGNYPNFVRAKTGIVTIRANESNYEKNLITNWNNLVDVPGETKVDTFLNTPGTVLQPKEVINIITSDGPLNLPPKFIYQVGRLPGKPKGKALVQMAQALIDSDDPETQQLVKKSGLESKLKELTTLKKGEEQTPLKKLIQAEEFLTEVVSKTADPDVNNLKKRIDKVGWENLSPKEQLRFANSAEIIYEDLKLEKENDIMADEFSNSQAGKAVKALSNK